jgi:hypothetical protein
MDHLKELTLLRYRLYILNRIIEDLNRYVQLSISPLEEEQPERIFLDSSE